MRKVLVVVLFSALSFSSYSRIYVNGIEVSESEIRNLQEYLRYRAVADMVFEKSRVASLKYYEKVLEKFPEDFVSLSRISLIYAMRGIPELSLHYGTNALRVYKKSDRKGIYTVNYIELLVALSLSYTKLRDEVNSYFYLDEAKSSLSKLLTFRHCYSKGSSLVEYAYSLYRREFYNILTVTNTNHVSTRRR